MSLGSVSTHKRYKATMQPKCGSLSSTVVWISLPDAALIQLLIAEMVSPLCAVAETCNLCWDVWWVTDKHRSGGSILSFALAGHGVSG